MIKLLPKSYPHVIITRHNPENIELYNEVLGKKTYDRTGVVYNKNFLIRKVVQVYHNSSKYLEIVISIECSNCHKKIYFNKYRRLNKFAYNHPALKLNTFTPRIIKVKLGYIEYKSKEK